MVIAGRAPRSIARPRRQRLALPQPGLVTREATRHRELHAMNNAHFAATPIDQQELICA